ncbi:Disintegrin and metalloproteinase domain-containing protein B [Colletotrichum chlorophyti]|uniref:Disintegrin and metalloproteinase domain-containing protein B n=1 Tax=Colletotrichum chlorophyti TaxID=708187 RepID=A0A1Q8RYA2_9PEZI|nr:Disintegrin and metalloproteinase domain-containing protein B [Colletotrichum chlorophyti]
MVAFRTIAAAFVALAALPQTVLADSMRRNPLKYVTVIEDAVFHSPSQHCHALSHFDLTFSLHNREQEIRLALEPNHDILENTMEVTYIGADGSTTRTEKMDRSEHRVFRGKAFVRRDGGKSSEWRHAGWARVTVLRDGQDPIFQGAFRIDDDHHHIQTGSNYHARKLRQDPDAPDRRNPDDYMVVWRDSDVMEYYSDEYSADREELKKREKFGRTACGSDSLDFNADYKRFDARKPDPLQSTTPSSLFGRSVFGAGSGSSLFARQIDGSNGAGVNLVSTIGQTNGCPTTRKIALMGVATDCTYTAAFNSTQTVKQNIIDIINSASEVYESSFNISLGIQNLTISEANCPGQASSTAPWNVACSPSITITDRLSLFSAWRGNSRDNNAFWTLLSTCGTDSAVGLAWLGQACTTGAQSMNSNETVASANVVIQTPSEWQVVAHEVGHTFGAVHDCESRTCSAGDAETGECCPLSSSTCDAAGQYIMNPSTGTNIRAFSPCSIGNICSGLLRNQVKSSCLTNNRDVNTITGGQCGNGIVESGEDCDCGGASGCGSNRCCDPQTCKFTSGSVCDPANEDCCNGQCQFASNGTVCRQSTGSCDPEETCSGTSATCGSDQHKDDGDSCGNSGDGLTCASGQCTSRDQQCKTAWGSRYNSTDIRSCSSGSSDCMISCIVPGYRAGACVTINQNFIDGTSCTGNGKCSNGQCQGSNAGDEILDWIRNNKGIFIPVAVVVGLLILIVLFSCVCGACRRSRKRTRARQMKPVAPHMANTWNGYGGAWSNPNIPPPPPVATRPGAPPPYQNDWTINRTQSARYA